ncbi:Nramp family divalent metal transporter [Simiduia sp. 21SJ11W-1]|uniref:Nramp family divalent metal transporter n=1 Tax=Simiduia sp. 21SJ11W-1 TaxID=2909669 RepID=UPI00209FE829|nr:Nramp family divalent metal transporter [Simiduia sp. 21SJ11W-1]UTA46959.1 Nramp family divalent metal transporter [Simiduia sp. 21SJ11W-1]
MKKITLGPGLLVAAAFIGPGTLATASQAGASFGFALLWALVFSIAATWVLQEMAARLGLVTRQGLAEALRAHLRPAWLIKPALVLVVAAIGLGNAAYEAGNIMGATLGISALVPGGPVLWALLIGTLAALLLWTHRYRLLERVLVTLVVLMSTVFVVTLAMVQPDWASMAAGILRPQLPDGSAMLAIALIGTTVVPYNLFLHASSVANKWPAHTPLPQALTQARWDTGLSISLGGLITLAILSTAAVAFFQTGHPFSPATMAQQLEPLLGEGARWCYGLGLFAAGLTSAIAAPMAAGFAVSGALGLQGAAAIGAQRWVSLGVVLVGTVFAALGTKPLVAIVFAQAFNGFLLPIVAIFLLYVMNQRALLGSHANGWLANLLGGLVVIFVTGLSLWKLASLLPA